MRSSHSVESDAHAEKGESETGDSKIVLDYAHNTICSYPRQVLEESIMQTIRLFYRGQQGRVRQNFNWGITPPITKKSVIIMSAGEATAVDPNIPSPEDAVSFNLGDADVDVTNVSPHDGGVEFILHVNWGSPLDVLVTLTVLDPYEQFFDVN